MRFYLKDVATVMVFAFLVNFLVFVTSCAIDLTF